MNITLRSEVPSDYYAIAELHAVTFSYGFDLSEVVIVDGQRHLPNFDHELSLVAEDNGKVVGHVLFQPYEVRIDSQPIQAVCLAPISVHPEYQKKGIGGRLIEEGCNRARDKGYEMSFLLGHSSYYPRFGYQPRMFGTCTIQIKRSELKENQAHIEERRVQAADIPLLASWWSDWYEKTDLSIFPGTSVLNWISHGKGTRSSLVMIDGEEAGYLSYEVHKPYHIQCFLAKNRESAGNILSYLNETLEGYKEDEISIALHPEADATKRLIPYSYHSTIDVWDAGMIKILDPQNEQIHRYCREVKLGERPPGLIVWPTLFQL